MARIEGVVLPGNKRVEYALTYLHGIGLARSRDILHALGINFDIRVNQLSDKDVAAIQHEIGDKYPIEGELRKKVHVDIQRLKEIGSYRGDRHKKGLPVRGQRTSTNARTRKGPKRAGMAVALKRKVTKK